MGVMLRPPGNIDEGMLETGTADDEFTDAVNIGIVTSLEHQNIDVTTISLGEASDVSAVSKEQLHIGHDILNIESVLRSDVGIQAALEQEIHRSMIAPIDRPSQIRHIRPHPRIEEKPQ